MNSSKIYLTNISLLFYRLYSRARYLFDSITLTTPLRYTHVASDAQTIKTQFLSLPIRSQSIRRTRPNYIQGRPHSRVKINNRIRD